ncbi:ankyrin repeat domain-containing protein [Psychromicrobium sp. YIM B11713]|uniref:ankyrin repeat domain-containing protein n=1 Tax=Psychromicrobium sp. YIM B11713 TaxID=3145233 RepID=UPI00374F3A0F
MAKRKTLPKNFGELLKTASVEELKRVFDKCLLDARGGYQKQTAIGFLDCPDELILWLADQGLDVDTPDAYGGTPLWERASMGRVAQIPLLISLGADIERRRSGGVTPLHGAAGWQKVNTTRVLLQHGADLQAVTDTEGETPLLYALRRTRNASIADTAQVVKLLLEAGTAVTDEMRYEVERIGKDFEFHRANFNPDYLAETEAGLAELYALSGVTPVVERKVHDGVSPILVSDGGWREQYELLWEMLVPSSGAAKTVQGEAIRITGRISHEILGNGGANWDREFKKMLDVLPEHFASGNALSASELDEAQVLVKALRSGDGDAEQLHRLSELAVAWVVLNPSPIALPSVPYGR